MSNKVINLGIVGVGKIVFDQHLPSIAKNSAFNLVATASRNASVDGVRAFSDITSMLDATQLDAVALCMPPQYRQAAAQIAIQRGKHVLLEKPPGATVSEVELLSEIAQKKGVSLYSSWHSRHAAAVATAKELLSHRRLLSANLVWKEDVRKWHPGQQWIWQAGGLGVFDPGINGLSILTYCLNSSMYVSRASLAFPLNKVAPIAADIDIQTRERVKIACHFDWRIDDNDVWAIDFQTDKGLIQLKDGGATVLLDGQEVAGPPSSEHAEYETIYANFSDIIERGVSEVDLSPLKLVADAFLLGDRQQVAAFVE